MSNSVLTILLAVEISLAFVCCLIAALSSHKPEVPNRLFVVHKLLPAVFYLVVALLFIHSVIPKIDDSQLYFGLALIAVVNTWSIGRAFGGNAEKLGYIFAACTAITIGLAAFT